MVKALSGSDSSKDSDSENIILFLSRSQEKHKIIINKKIGNKHIFIYYSSCLSAANKYITLFR